MDPNGEAGAFEPLLTHYRDIAKLIIGLAVGSIALLAGYVGFALQKESVELGLIQRVIARPLTFFCFSVIYLLLFSALLVASYETYRHSKLYTRAQYALNLALGYSGLACFVFGYLELVWSVISRKFK